MRIFMNDSGIIAQYGFLYQRKVFMLYVMRHVSTAQLFTFEGRDDIETESNKIYAIQDSSQDSSCYIQVKSGKVSEECFSRIICNWLLLDASKTTNFKLTLENDLPFDYLSKKRAALIYRFIVSGKNKRKTAISRKTYEKYKDQIDVRDKVIKQIESLLNHFEKIVMSMEEADQALVTIFSKDYCLDITDYKMAKSKRLERFLSYVDFGINNAIKNKKPYKLLYKNFVQLVMQVKEEISDKKYTIDIQYLKKRSKETAKKIVKERIAREVKQLYLVDGEYSFVVDGIVHELIYKDFRRVYEQHKAIEISNLEQEANENYKSVKFALSENDRCPKNVFIKTIDKQIESEILPPGQIYRKGCYIYLTGDHAQKDVQITWGEEK